MESVLWYVLTGARGGPNRIRILQALDQQPRNANRLAEDLDLDYTTIRHHLDVLMEHNLMKNSNGGYATVYLLDDRVENNWSTVEEIIETVESS